MRAASFSKVKTTHPDTHTDLWHFVIIGWFGLVIRLRVTGKQGIMWSMAPHSHSHTNTHTKKWKSNRLEFRSVKIWTCPWDNLLSISDQTRKSLSSLLLRLPKGHLPAHLFLSHPIFQRRNPTPFPFQGNFTHLASPPLIYLNLHFCCHFTLGKHLNLKISNLTEVAIWAWVWYP